ncbi:MAG: hypothetical protein AAF492_00030 [Verrucomicrobiota bacterium]
MKIGLAFLLGWAPIALYAGEGFFLTVGGIDTEGPDGHRIEAEFGTICRSVDGEKWREAFKGGPVKDGFNHAKNNMLRCMTYGHGRFVATGNPKAIVTSTDGLTWTVVEAPGGGMSVEFGNGIFLAPNAYSFMRSTDGLIWDKSPLKPDFKVWGREGAGHVRKTVFGNGVFVCVGEQRLGVTKDGLSWVHHEILSDDKRPGRNVLLFGNGRFVWLTEKQGVRTSTDGIEWLPVDFPEVTGKHGENGVFDGHYFWTSAATWKDPKKAVYRSNDGVNWELAAESSGTPAIRTAGNGLLLANIGHAKSFKFSSDGGKSWKEANVGIGSRKVYFFDGKRMVGQSGG